MRHLRHSLTSCILLLFLLSALPGRSAEVRLCLGHDGHLLLAQTIAYGHTVSSVPCHREVETPHGPCTDFVMHPADVHALRAVAVHPPQPAPITPPHRLFAQPVAALPLPAGRPASAAHSSPLDHLCTVILLL